MIKEDYLKTINVNGINVDIGMDDYGQCYYFEYDKDGEHLTESCGTYNIYYADYIYESLDKEFRKLYHKSIFNEDEMSQEELNTLDKYYKLIEEAYKK